MDKFTVIDQRIHAYMLAHQSPEHPILRELRELTSSMPESKMQISPEQGNLLSFLIRLTGARECLEIGTFAGYSALAMALALPNDGHLVTCDISDEWSSIGRPFWARAGVQDRISLKLGPAAETLAMTERSGGHNWLDLAFIDADKTSYDTYFEIALRLVRPGGLIILDNTLRRGRVADPTDTHQDTVALDAINKKIATDDRIDFVLLPIATGMTLVRKR
jgi:O-methyltransferase